ncbi:trigger factor [uncultured Microscilla sp.]|uniref:trigger factor n=1 Tax=uncultured Microscilla sp. TaxID=432653 RepID=UPI00261CE615|nr:trigger factor [uncultured Microscilla sp.]
MDIVLDKKDATNASIKIKVSEADYKQQFNNKLKEYSKKVQLKGFRPGKVPAGVIKKMYGKGILVEEINHLLSSSLSSYIVDNKLPLVGQPMPEEQENENTIDWDNQKDFEFSYRVGLAGEYEYNLENVTVTSYNVTVADEDVQEVIENIRKQQGKSENPEEVAAGDMIFGKLEQVLTKKAKEEGETAYEKDVLIDTEKVVEAEVEKIVGLKKEAHFDFTIRKFFKDGAETIKEIAGLSLEEAKALKGKYRFTIENITRQAEAELNQDLFDNIFGPDTVNGEEEFIEKVRESIAENFEKDTDLFLQNTIRDKVLESVDIALPDEFLKDWLYESNEGKFSKSQIEEEYEKYANERRWSLIVGRIAEENDFKIEDDEILEQAKNFVRSQIGGAMAMSPQIEEMIDSLAERYLNEDNGRMVEQFESQIMYDKVLDFVKGKIKIETKDVSKSEFEKIVTA